MNIERPIWYVVNFRKRGLYFNIVKNLFYYDKNLIFNLYNYSKKTIIILLLY